MTIVANGKIIAGKLVLNDTPAFQALTKQLPEGASVTLELSEGESYGQTLMQYYKYVVKPYLLLVFCKSAKISIINNTSKFNIMKLKKSHLSANELARLALEAFADAANAILHTAIAEQADLQNEANEVADIFAELDLVPENACEDIALEALSAGSAFDNAEPTPAFSLHYEMPYEMPTNLYDLDELSNVIAEEEWRALGTVDAEISAVKAKLIELNDKRIGIVEECAHWRGKCDRAIEIAEYEASYEANEADADLRQSIWLSTGQDIM